MARKDKWGTFNIAMRQIQNAADSLDRIEGDEVCNRAALLLNRLRLAIIHGASYTVRALAMEFDEVNPFRDTPQTSQ